MANNINDRHFFHINLLVRLNPVSNRDTHYTTNLCLPPLFLKDLHLTYVSVSDTKYGLSS